MQLNDIYHHAGRSNIELTRRTPLRSLIKLINIWTHTVQHKVKKLT